MPLASATRRNLSISVRMNRANFAISVVREGDAATVAESAAGADHGAELLAVGGFGEEVEGLGLASSPGAPEEARRQHTAAVQDQEITGPQVAREVGEGVVGEIPGRAVEDEKPRGIAGVRGKLRDEFLREVVVEVAGLQKSFFCGRSGSGRGSKPK